MNASYKICLLPGDGIGPEVVEQAVKAVDAVCRKFGHEVEYTFGYVGACAIDHFGNAYPEETHNICMNIQSLSFMVGQGFAVSATSLVGQSLGRKRLDMAEHYGLRCRRISL